MGASFISSWLLMVSLLMPSCSGAVVVTKPVPLKVLLGRSVFVEPYRHLNVNYSSDSSCQVVVLQADPLSQRMGYLVPDVFRCDFLQGDVQYTHLGSKFCTEDFVRLQIRVDTNTETQFVPVTLRVSVVFSHMEIVQKNLPIAVPVVGGLSAEINEEVVSFNYDETSQSCRVVILDFTDGIAPRFGELVNVTKDKGTSAQYECRDFLEAGICYTHTNLNSANRDHVQLFVERKDKTSGDLKTEYFQMIIRILGARSNQRPVASFQASHTVEVKQYAMAPITQDILAASDSEIDEDEIIFNVTQPLGPGQGQLVHTDDPYQQLTAFYQKDVTDLKITYTPPVQRSSKLRMFQVILKAVDDHGATSDPIMLLIMVRPTNIRAPIVTKNAGLSLFEGQSRPLSDKTNLAVSDRDNLRDVRISVIGGLKHGDLRMLGKKIGTFMATDLELGVVMYHHDDSETYSDNILFRMSDGVHSVDFLFAVTIGAVDDLGPVLVHNTGLTLDEGEVANIDMFMLSALDVDSDDDEIQFQVLPGPASSLQGTAGVLCLRQQDSPSGVGWVLQEDGFYEKNVTRFFQENITAGRLFYRHLGGELFHDDINFVLLDNADEPNASPAQTFNIFINQIDDLPPELYPGCMLSLVADEGKVTEVSSVTLRYTDRDSQEDDLSFLISREPYFLDLNSSQNAGDIVMAATGKRVVKFSQMEVNHRKIAFKAPDVELGPYPARAQLEFSVSDMTGNTISHQILQIILQPVNNKAPEVVSRTISLTELQQVVIDDRYFTVYDEDTAHAQLRFTVTDLPRYGVLRRGDAQLHRLEAFTVYDVIRSQLSYQHVSPGEASDEIGLSVDDGVQNKAFLLEIVILPKRKVLTSQVYVMQLKVAERSRKMIKIAEVPGDEPERPVMLRLTSPPQEGEVMLGGMPAKNVSVQDLKNGLLYYEHTGKETGLQGDHDLFNLTLSNQSDVWIMAGNRYIGVQVNLVILPVDNVAPVVNVLPLTVDEGQKVQLTPRHVSVFDPDTRHSDITCMIDVQPNVGFLENVAPLPGSEKSNAGKRITLFKIQDVNRGNIYYVQDTHEDVEPQMDWLAFSCTDNINTSPRYLLNIGILPRNDEEPQIFIREFVVEEGSYLIIDLTVLNAVDTDSPLDELMFYVITPPKHGLIEKKGKPVNRFTLTQIQKTASIVYQHDGSETLRDSLLLSVSDGIHNKTKRVSITILPVDDEEPTMTVNTGLRLKSYGESKIISPWNLQATDADTFNDNLTFIVRTPPWAGRLQLVRRNGSVLNLTQWSMFLQREISSSQLVYTQNPSIPSRRDQIRFDVTDGLNTLINQVFHVEVEADDRVLPIVISKGVRLRQNSRLLLTTDFLSASDANSLNTELRYSLITQPQKGHLESLDAPGIAIQNFTQLDLAANRIIYVHSGSDEDTIDSFDFQVSDGTNSVKRKFLVTLLNVNNKRPVLIYTSGAVQEGDSMLLTPFELRAEDQDTDDEHIVFIVSRVPLHGVLLKGESPASSFSQADINDNLISYVHDGTDTLSDSFRFSVRDGAHDHFYVFPDTGTPTRATQEFHITIQPVDNRRPQLTLNRGATNLHVLPGARLGVTIGGDVLRAEDRDSDDSLLLYVVTSPPEHGILLNNNVTVLNFTQSDLNSRHISYVLHSASNATADSVGFIVKDPAGNTLENQVFTLSWTWVSFEKSAYNVSETGAILKVSLVRRGFLGHASFVRMSARGITAKPRADFSMASAAHVQFSPGQSHAEWRLHIKDDVMYEVRKTVALELLDARMCVIGRLHSAVVTITDPEDVPRVEMVRTGLVVEENCGELRIPLQRMGDTSQRLHVLCVTRHTGEQGWATGASPTAVLSLSDFISRPEDKSSVITFKSGESLKYCSVTIIDDTLYEGEEKFEVKLVSHYASKVSPTRNTTQVIIVPDPTDEPKISFERANYSVDESDGRVEVTLQRTGSDLSTTSSVFVRSRQLNPISARAGEDYDPLTKIVYFASHVTSQTFYVNIVDDAGQPSIEGPKNFEVVLRTPVNAGLGTAERALFTINDSFSDLPSIQFERAAYLTEEGAGIFSVLLMRTGDLSLMSSVRCYTRQMNAIVSEDFIERPDSQESIVIFEPGENRKKCNVAVCNDVLYEGLEDFRLVLRSVSRDVRIGEKNQTVITISDTEDKPVVQFSRSSVFVSEPLVESLMTEAVVEVVKHGDLTTASRVRVYTLDASAKAGIDYQPLTQILDFTGSVSRHQIILKILFNADRQLRRVFTVHLTSNVRGKGELGRSKVIVYIDKSSPNPAVTFPLQPQVVSLRHYDGDSEVPDEVVRGYPVICVTACNPKFPRYDETGSLCRSQDIANSLTQYRWQVALGHARFRDLNDVTFFTRTDGVTLDGVYLFPGARVRCITRAVNSRGELGIESRSEPVVVSKTEGLCVARDPDHVGSDRFVPSIAFTGSRQDALSNMVHIKVRIPHTDGLIPVLSTRKLTDFKQVTGPGVLRVAQHKCSNLLDVDEVQTRFSFVGRHIKDPDSLQEGEPYQYSTDLRGNRTLRFYKNLNLQTCMWTFSAYYDISEIVQYCAATVTTDGASRDFSQSQLTLRVPLFVSFVYRLSTAAGDWVHYDHAMFLRLSLTYDTAVLLKDGVQTLDGAMLSGDLWPTSITVREKDKRLVVRFKTKTKFRGIFLIEKAGTDLKSMVVSRDRPRLSFHLSLVTGDKTFDNPLQSWQFESNFAVRDYTGVYYIKLIPCTATKGVQYSEPIACSPRDSITFTLPIRFQQINDPVPARFTLSAQFNLFSLKEHWLSPHNLSDLIGDIVFSKESKIFGRITLVEGDRQGRGGTGYVVSAEKIYLCAGMAEYTPSYDPQNHKFGCLADEHYLIHRLKILDKEEPNSVKTQIGMIPFDAKFASDDPDATRLTQWSDSDGFVLNSAPLFEVPSDRKWFMHAVYSVTSKKKTNQRSSRDTDWADTDLHKTETTVLHQLTKPMLDDQGNQRMHSMYRRDAESIEDIGNNGKGTNLKMIRLIREPADDLVNNSPGEQQHEDAGSTGAHDQGLVNPLVIGIAVVCGVLVVALVVVGLVFRRKLRSRPPPAVAANKEEVAVAHSEGTRV